MFEYFGNTDVGKVRKNNEDFYVYKKIDKDEHLFIVADGMGGHRAGDVASSLGTTTFVKEYKKLRGKDNSISDSLNLSLQKANTSILNKATKEPEKKGMGTTFSALVIKDMKGNIIHVGDSRIYLIRKNKIKRLTRDHTFVEKMIEEGKIKEKDAKTHPHRNILYYSLGARDSLTPQLIENFDIFEKDAFLLCSDGLNSMVEDTSIKDYCILYPPQRAVNELIHLANINGGTDNITIQIVHFGNVAEQDKTETLNVGILREKKTFFIWSLIVLLLIFLIYVFLIK